MSNIPSTAISAALTPIQRASTQVVRARGLQVQKNQHHSEEVNELDDTAVNSVHDQQEQRGGAEQDAGDDEGAKKKGEELVDIEGLQALPQAGKEGAEVAVSHLDISA